MGTKAGLSVAITAAVLWTACILVVQGLPLEHPAALWRFRAAFFIAWFLGLVILWYWFQGYGYPGAGGSGARRIADMIDPVTGLHSRSSFREISEPEQSCSQRAVGCHKIVFAMRYL